ncbi:Monothiol glutaredoxin-S17 [Vitis vinifera]|uniref:Monothiol glutaredoxin-S17 n=1 Tax=Vitis vinifera TaxID=29760 RepID=A0A438H0S4_VITVI|nr:Monothiol glutaredoxin-S17 [Vitis vinifera]
MIDGVYIGAQLAVPELEGGSVLILRRRDHFFKKNIFMSTGEMGLLLAGFRGFIGLNQGRGPALTVDDFEGRVLEQIDTVFKGPPPLPIFLHKSFSIYFSLSYSHRTPVFFLICISGSETSKHMDQVFSHLSTDFPHAIFFRVEAEEQPGADPSSLANKIVKIVWSINPWEAAAPASLGMAAGPTVLETVKEWKVNCHQSSKDFGQQIVVVVDVDEVLGNFVSVLNRFIVDRYSLKHSVSEYHVYDFFKIWNCSRDEADIRVHEFFKTSYFKTRIHSILVGNHFALYGESRPKLEICRSLGAKVVIDDNPRYAIVYALCIRVIP